MQMACMRAARDCAQGLGFVRVKQSSQGVKIALGDGRTEAGPELGFTLWKQFVEALKRLDQSHRW
jgi:hypothetical protein